MRACARARVRVCVCVCVRVCVHACARLYVCVSWNLYETVSVLALNIVLNSLPGLTDLWWTDKRRAEDVAVDLRTGWFLDSGVEHVIDTPRLGVLGGLPPAVHRDE